MAAPVFVQGARGFVATTTSSVTMTHTAGNFLVVLCALDNYQGTSTIVTDTLGNTFEQVVNSIEYPQGLTAYIVRNVKGGANTITTSYVGSSGAAGTWVLEYSGVTCYGTKYLAGQSFDPTSAQCPDRPYIGTDNTLQFPVDAPSLVCMYAELATGIGVSNLTPRVWSAANGTQASSTSMVGDAYVAAAGTQSYTISGGTIIRKNFFALAIQTESTDVPTTVTGELSTNKPVEGQTITLTATVSADGTPNGGTVTVSDENGQLASAPVSSGAATLTFSLTKGTHTLVVAYSGVTGFAASTETVTVTVGDLAPLSIGTFRVEVNGPYPNRIQLILGDGVTGPFVQGGPLGKFDPRRDLEVYVDGNLLPVRSFTFDKTNNRYLLYMERTFNLKGVIQVVHHMPSPPFQWYEYPVPEGF